MTQQYPSRLGQPPSAFTNTLQSGLGSRPHPQQYMMQPPQQVYPTPQFRGSAPTHPHEITNEDEVSFQVVVFYILEYIGRRSNENTNFNRSIKKKSRYFVILFDYEWKLKTAALLKQRRSKCPRSILEVLHPNIKMSQVGAIVILCILTSPWQHERALVLLPY